MERDMSEEFPEDDLDWEISSLLKPRQKRYMEQETRNFFKSIKKLMIFLQRKKQSVVLTSAVSLIENFWIK